MKMDPIPSECHVYVKRLQRYELKVLSYGQLHVSNCLDIVVKSSRPYSTRDKKKSSSERAQIVCLNGIETGNICLNV